MLRKRAWWVLVVGVVLAVGWSSAGMSQCWECNKLMNDVLATEVAGHDPLLLPWVLNDSVALYFMILHDIGEWEFEETDLDLSDDILESYRELYHDALESATYLLIEVLLPEAYESDGSSTFIYAANAMSLSSGLLAECALYCQLLEDSSKENALEVARKLEPTVKSGLKKIAAMAAKAIGKIEIKLPRIWLPWPFKKYIGGQTILTIDITAIINKALGVANEIMCFIAGKEYQPIPGD